MRGVFVFLLLCIASSVCVANCTYFTEKDEVLYVGYPITYTGALDDLFLEKEYRRVYEKNLADYIFVVELKETRGNIFKRAYANLSFFKKEEGEKKLWSVNYWKRCITQSCSVWDMGKALRKAFEAAEKRLEMSQGNCLK